jgi:hypothetical protein
MTPKFTQDGQVCSLRLYPARISSTTNYLQDTLDYWELKSTLNRLAPPERRGKKTILFGLINGGGGRSETIYSFENVTFTFLKSVSPYLSPIGTKTKLPKPTTPHRPTTPSRPTTPKRVSDEASDNEMVVPRDAEIVTITWNGKSCGS